PLINALVPPYLVANDRFHSHIFLMYYISDMADMRVKTDPQTLQSISTILATTCQISATQQTQAYRLYLIDDTAVVAFRSDHSQRCINGHAPN
ncbi:hypothetical protein, partial [Dyella silvatica]|uniref:hypothetical protein n=1 Tax=Dyella silvatica TaxID=2992128 RepID=UPI00225A3B1C